MDARVVSTSAQSVKIYPSRRVRGLFECLLGRSMFVSLGFAPVRCREIAVLRMELIGYPLRLKTPIKCFSSFAFNCGVLQCVSALLKSDFMQLCLWHFWVVTSVMQNLICVSLFFYRRTFPIDHFVFCVPQRPGKGANDLSPPPQ